MRFTNTIYFFVVLFCISLKGYSQCLSGVYTVGGTNPNYATLGAATADLMAKGVCGPVNFKMRPGIYAEHLFIRKYAGASEANRVTFEPELSDSLSVEIQDSTYTIFSSTILTMDSAGYITFSHLVFRMVSSYYYNAILMRNGCVHNRISNCTFISQDVPNSMSLTYNLEQYTSILIQHQTLRHNNYNTIENCYFQGGGAGVMLKSINTTCDSNNLISNSIFRDQMCAGIYAYGQAKLRICNNHISSVKNPTVSSPHPLNGLHIEQVKDSILITGNSVTRTGGNEVCYMLLSDTCDIVMYNNFLFNRTHVYYTSSPPQVFNYRANSKFVRLDMAYNTIRSCNKAWYAVYIYNQGKVFLRNNNVISDSTLALHYDSLSFSKYQAYSNNWVTGYGNPIVFNSVSYASASQLYAHRGRYDSLSVSVMPAFTDPDGYYLNDSLLAHKALPLNWVADDINGTLRNPVMATIGCAEITGFRRYDLDMRRVSNINLNCPGTYTVNLTIRNAGTDTLHSIVLGWEANGQPQSNFTFTGTLAPLDSIAGLAIGTYTSTGATNLKVYPVSLDGQPDQRSSNDTAYYNRTRGSLSGVYTIGSTGCDFSTPTDANTALQLYGICGPVVFKIKRGVYLGNITFQNIAGSSPVNTIEFTSESGNPADVIIYRFCSYGYVGILLNQVKYFKFSHVTIAAIESNPQFPNNGTIAIKVQNSNHIYIDSCVLANPKGSSGGFNSCNLSIRQCDTIEVTNNQFSGGYYNVYVDGYLAPTANHQSLLIKNNMATNSWNGIYVSNQNLATIDGNVLWGQLAALSYTGSEGIKVVSGKGITVAKNKVYKYDEGMGFGSLNTFQGLRSSIVNNFVNGWMQMVQCKNTDILHNSIYLSQNGTSNATAALELQDDSALVMLNNNLVSTRTSATHGAMYVYSSSGFPLFSLSDHNNFYAPGAGFEVYYIGPYMSLAQWTAWWHLDSNSVVRDPNYMGIYDYHLADTLLKGLGKPAGVLTDIDGDPRPALPTIGADEASGTLSSLQCVWPGDANNDLTVDNTDLLPLGLKFGQTGFARAITSNTWRAHACQDWNDTLGTGLNTKHADCNGDSTVGAADTLAINLNYGQQHQRPLAVVQSTNPDIFLTFNKSQYLPGDTVLAYVQIGSSANPQTNFYGSAFKLYYDNTVAKPGSEQFYYNNSWVGNINQNTIKFSKIFSSAGEVDASLVRTNHTDVSGYGKVATLRFILRDTINTNHYIYFTTAGTVKTDHNGTVAALNGGIDSVLLQLGTTHINPISENGSVIVFPNPANDRLVISCENMIQAELYNSLGQVVLSHSSTQQRAVLHTSSLENGVYSLTVQTDKVLFSRKIIVVH